MFCKLRWRARGEVVVEDLIFALAQDFRFAENGVGFIDQASVDGAPVAEARGGFG